MCAFACVAFILSLLWTGNLLLSKEFDMVLVIGGQRLEKLSSHERAAQFWGLTRKEILLP
jgi:hypothetical protein